MNSVYYGVVVDRCVETERAICCVPGSVFLKIIHEIGTGSMIRLMPVWFHEPLRGSNLIIQSANPIMQCVLAQLEH